MFRSIFYFISALLACIAASPSRYFDPRLSIVETQWMNRESRQGISPNILYGEPDCTAIGTPPDLIHLRGGSSNRGSGGFIFLVHDYWNHPRYGDPGNIRRFMYDVSLLQTRSDSLMQGANVIPVALPPNCPENPNNCCQVCAGTTVTVTGWGITETGASSPTLKQLTTPLVSWADCARDWGNFSPGFFCTAVIDGSDVEVFDDFDEFSCGGDSGSPLVTGTGANRVQQGVVSFGTATCGDGVPSVQIRIEYEPVRDWIRQLSGL